MPKAPLSIAELSAGFLSAEAEIETLTSQWSALETDVRNGSPSAKDAVAAIDAKFRTSDARRQDCLEAIAITQAASLPDAADKLAVAVSDLSGEGGLVHDIVADALTTLRAHIAPSA